MLFLIQFNLFGFLPEPVLMLIFGVFLIAFTGALRRVFNRNKEAEKSDSSADGQPSGAQRNSLKEKLS